MSRFGIFAKIFPGTSPGPVLAAVAGAGFGCAQFNLACAGLDPVPHEISPEVRDSIVGAARAAGVTLAALSGTVNLIHPDRAVRADGRARLAAVIAAAPGCGVRLVTLCTGSRDPLDQWRAHPDNAGRDAWRDLIVELEAAIAVAERHDVLLGIEPESGNVVATAGAARRLLDQLDSPRLRIVLDPANLIDGVAPDRARSTIADAVALLADRIGLAHAKDRDRFGVPVAPGKGVIDFAGFLGHLARVGYAGPIIAHGFAASDAPGVRVFLHQAAERARSAAP